MPIGHLLMRAEGTPLQVGDSLHGFNKLAYLTVRTSLCDVKGVLQLMFTLIAP